MGSWPRYYDSLKLFSPAHLSSLPGTPFPGAPDHYPLRDEVSAYLDAYARAHAFPIAFGQRVVSVSKAAATFTIRTADSAYLAKAVIVASGPFNQPNIPKLNGLSDFGGTVLHSSQYANRESLEGGDTAIVGAGNSAVQIAYELAAHRPVTLFTRAPVRFLKQRPLGRDIHHWLRAIGYDTAPLGAWLGLRLTEPVLDEGIYRQSMMNGRIVRRTMFERLVADGALMEDGTHIPFRSLVLATGFSQAPDFLTELPGAIVNGRPDQRGGRARTIAGLYYLGLPWQRSHASATLRGVGPDAKRIVAALEAGFKTS